MSDDQQISIPANRPEDCPAEQSSMDYEVSFPLSPPIDETEMSSKDDDAASPASPQKEDVCLVPQSNNVADTESLSKENDNAASPPKEDANCASPPKEDANRASPPKEDANRASPPKEDANRASPLKEDANRASPPKEDVTPESPSKENVAPEYPPKEVVAPESPPKEVVAPESPPKEDVAAAPPQMNDTNHTASRSSLPSNKNIASEPKVKTEVSKSYTYELTNSDYDSDLIKQEIKHETIDLGNETHYYDDNDDNDDHDDNDDNDEEIPLKIVKIEPVGFDRGLEPDHIVGATEQNGKLMFLVAWKGTEVADLLESTVVYKKCPQLAIKFFEARLRYYP